MSVMHRIINIQENHTSLVFRNYGFSITISVNALLDYSKYFETSNFLRLSYFSEKSNISNLFN